jgi:hypothetical protein
LTSYLAHRMAGQALAALWHGVPIAQADIDGVVVKWPDKPGCEEVLADIAIWLAGVAASDGLRFGRPGSYDGFIYWRFDEVQRADVAKAAKFAETVDPTGVDDVLYLSWRRALEFRDLNWSTIESLAKGILDCERLTSHEVEDLAADAFWHRETAPQRNPGRPSDQEGDPKR